MTHPGPDSESMAKDVQKDPKLDRRRKYPGRSFQVRLAVIVPRLILTKNFNVTRAPSPLQPWLIRLLLVTLLAFPEGSRWIRVKVKTCLPLQMRVDSPSSWCSYHTNQPSLYRRAIVNLTIAAKHLLEPARHGWRIHGT